MHQTSRRAPRRSFAGGLLTGGLLAAWLASASLATAGELDLQGFLAGRGSSVEGPLSWTRGGFGRLGLDAAGSADDLDGDPETYAGAKAQLVLDWRPGRAFGGYLHLAGRLEPDLREGDAGGVVEAYLRGSFNVSQGDQLKVRLGHFLLPTSKENVELGWSSPYTLTLSAINSWIAEEVRLSGLLSEYRFALGPIHQVRAGVTVFGGNDTAGALLAWRGWAMGDRLSTFGEDLPLPPLDSFEPGGPFDAQSERRTRPFDRDLDGRPGWAAYLGWRLPEVASFQISHYDSRGDRALHDGEAYAWQTEFDLIGGEVHRGRSSFAAEWIDGSTGMGFAPNGRVQMDFEAAYLLASFTPGAFRLTLRYDTFEATERDFSIAEDNTDDGEAWTLAAFWEPRDDFRLGLELVDLEGEHPAAAASGFSAASDARSLILEARYYFGL